MKIQGIYNKVWLPFLFLPVWWVVYKNLATAVDWIVFSGFGMTKGEHLAEAIWFFLFEFPKVMLLLTLIIFFVGIIRTFFTP